MEDIRESYSNLITACTGGSNTSVEGYVNELVGH
jgi:hypothetical protein